MAQDQSEEMNLKVVKWLKLLSKSHLWRERTAKLRSSS
jgi:hypothetical protein